MKLAKLVLLVLFLLNLAPLSSQAISTNINNYRDFPDGITYFIQSDDNDFNAALETVVAAHWTANNYEFINRDEITQKRGASSFFVDLYTYSYTRESSTTGMVNMDYEVSKFILSKDIKATDDGYKPYRTLCSIQLDEVNPAELIYGVQLVNNLVRFAQSLDTKKELDFKDLLAELSDENRGSIQAQTLYLIQEELKSGISTEEGMKGVYDHAFEFVTPAQIDEAIINQVNVVYTKIVNDRNLKYVVFIRAKDAQILYGKVMTGLNQAQIGPKLFKAINK